MTRKRKQTGSVLATILIGITLTAGCSATDTTSAGTGSAGTTSSEDANYLAKAETTQDEEQLICKRSKPTGSRISEKICMTAADWDKARDQSREMLDRATRKAQQYEDQ